jgi:hypothetical protein
MIQLSGKMSDGITEMYKNIVNLYDDTGKEMEKVTNDWLEKQRAATITALNLCNPEIKAWLIACTSDDDDIPYSSKDAMSGDEVQWFEVGHNATHYFSIGVRADGAFIQRISGPDYDEICECWYDKTTVEIVDEDEVFNYYWGHR